MSQFPQYGRPGPDAQRMDTMGDSNRQPQASQNLGFSRQSNHGLSQKPMYQRGPKLPAAGTPSGGMQQQGGWGSPQEIKNPSWGKPPVEAPKQPTWGQPNGNMQAWGQSNNMQGPPAQWQPFNGGQQAPNYGSLGRPGYGGPQPMQPSWAGGAGGYGGPQPQGGGQFQDMRGGGFSPIGGRPGWGGLQTLPAMGQGGFTGQGGIRMDDSPAPPMEYGELRGRPGGGFSPRGSSGFLGQMAGRPGGFGGK